jgi:hypothetical protein
MARVKAIAQREMRTVNGQMAYLILRGVEAAERELAFREQEAQAAREQSRW